jgi:hypothetical protein
LLLWAGLVSSGDYTSPGPFERAAAIHERGKDGHEIWSPALVVKAFRDIALCDRSLVNHLGVTRVALGIGVPSHSAIRVAVS